MHAGGGRVNRGRSAAPGRPPRWRSPSARAMAGVFVFLADRTGSKVVTRVDDHSLPPAEPYGQLKVSPRSASVFPKVHQVHRRRSRGHCDRGRFLRSRQRNHGQWLIHCQHRLVHCGRRRFRIRFRVERLERSGARRISWHGQQHIRVGLHGDDSRGSEGDHQGDVLHDLRERDEPCLGECGDNRPARPGTGDGRQRYHHGDGGHRTPACYPLPRLRRR